MYKFIFYFRERLHLVISLPTVHQVCICLSVCGAAAFFCCILLLEQKDACSVQSNKSVNIVKMGQRVQRENAKSNISPLFFFDSFLLPQVEPVSVELL